MYSHIISSEYELTTLMTNGYYRYEVRKYIYINTIILSFAGVMLGCITGHLFSKLTLKLLSGYTDYFIEKISLSSCLTGSAISVVLIVIMSVISLRSIDIKEGQ